MDMKKLYLTLLIASAFGFMLSFVPEVTAQTGYNYQPWRETDVLPNGQPRPLDFMTLGDQNHTYVRCRYGNSGRNWDQNMGTTGSGNYASHLLISSQSDDPCRCFNAGSSTNPIWKHEKVIPRSWDGNPDHYQDKVIRIGCYQHSGACMHSQEIEYWFYPPKDSSTLLVYFTFAQENVSSHDPDWNPKFSIEVLDGTNSNTSALVPGGYYNSFTRNNATGECNVGGPNTSWPYNRFLASPSGNGASQDFSCGPDDYGLYTYYWVNTSNTKTTPTTFPYRECPVAQTSGNALYPVTWFEYKPLAFDLSAYANAQPAKAVRLRIRAAACEGVAHWAYGMFAAKLMPGYISVDACGNDNITLSVPWGFLEETYEWHYGTDKQHSNGILEPNTTPGVNGNAYDLVLDPTVARIWPYYRCEMKSYTGVPFTYEAYIKKYDIQPDFSYTQVIDEDYPCSYLIKLQNTGKVCELTPKAAEAGYDTTFQTSGYHLHWYYKNSAGVYQTLPASENVDTPFFNVSNTADINLQNFNFDVGGDSIMIKLVVQDSLMKCIDSIELNIGLDSNFVKVGTKDTTVFACQNQLPYFYQRDKYGDKYRWDTPGVRECHVGDDFGDESWNYCDSVVTVTLQVMQPKLEIQDIGDYCDSFRTTLMVKPAANQAFAPEDIHVQNWNGDETATGTYYTAMTAGVYSVLANIGESGCSASATYKIAACMPFMNLPNSITPSNHDNINDCFEIPQKSLVKSIEFTVFNRNGTVVFHTTDVNFKWRGARFSEDYPDPDFTNQTYVYTLKMVDYNGKPYPVIKGSILVL